MGKDYYQTLALTRSATNDDVKKAYRKLSLKHHPDRSEDPKSEDLFIEVAEAYDVLSVPERRAVYDQFGEEGLKSGVPTTDIIGGFSGGYVFHGNPDKVFREFFGGDNPFSEFFESPKDPDMGIGFGGLRGRGRPKQDPPIERDLALTLEEIYRGCIKKMKISRRVMNDDGHTSSIRDKILTINVKAGWQTGTRITFPKEGDQGPNNIPADIVFIVKDKAHPLFKRDNNDLHYVATVPLGRALTGCVVEVPTLDGRVLSIPINDIVQPGYTKSVKGEGMPVSKCKDESKGNLFISFDIVFPSQLSPDKKESIKHALL